MAAQERQGKICRHKSGPVGRIDRLGKNLKRNKPSVKKRHSKKSAPYENLLWAKLRP